MVKLTRELLPKVAELLTAEEPRVCMSGGFGTGKSRGLCEVAFAHASHPGTRYALTRKQLVDLRATTIKTLLEPTGPLGPVLPEGTYTHNKSACEIKITGGGEIHYFGLDESSRVGSREFSGIGIDQAEETNETDFILLEGRLRLQAPGVKRQMHLVCNPGAPSHYIARRFGFAGGAVPMTGYRPITSATLDNWFLPKDYVAALQTFTGVAKKRFVEGLWAGSDKLVYDAFNREIHVKVRNDPRAWRRTVVGRDCGYTNPGCLLLIRQDGDGRVHVERECYEAKVGPKEWLTRGQEWNVLHHPEAFVTSEAGEISDWKSIGLPAVPANNERQEGVRIVRAHLVVAGDGLPRLTIDPSCRNLIREMETWETLPESKQNSERSDDFSKIDDHAPDALRYGVMHLTYRSPVSNTPDPVYVPQGYRE
jgi:phage terminase large subunit